MSMPVGIKTEWLDDVIWYKGWVPAKLILMPLNKHNLWFGGKTMGFRSTDLGSERPGLKSQICYLLVSISLLTYINGMVTPTNPQWVGLIMQWDNVGKVWHISMYSIHVGDLVPYFVVPDWQSEVKTSSLLFDLPGLWAASSVLQQVSVSHLLSLWWRCLRI